MSSARSRSPLVVRGNAAPERPATDCNPLVRHREPDEVMLHTDHMRVDPAYREALRAAGLDRVAHVLGRTDGRVAAWSRTTETLYVPSPGDRPGFFVKRYYYGDWSRRLRGALRGTFVGAHRGLAEYRLLREMRHLGLPAVRPVACGTRRVGHFVVASFLVTEEVPGARNMTSWASDVQAGRLVLPIATRRAIGRRLARQVARMHAAGFAHGQLFWRNTLIRFDLVGQPEFFFLDVRPRRGGRRMARRPRWWLFELAHLAASALPFSTRTERLRFLHEYYGARRLSPDFKEHYREIDRLTRRWLAHEQKRIRMNDLFEKWNRDLLAETGGTGKTDTPSAGPMEPHS